jgi:predicted transcriptional regulator
MLSKLFNTYFSTSFQHISLISKRLLNFITNYCINENINNNKRTLNDEKRPLKRPLNDNERPLNKNIKKHLADIILLLLSNEGVNRTELIAKMNIGRTSIFQYLQILRNAKLIEYIGSKKTGGYFLTKEAKDRLQGL